eukprot:gnl/Trimastix_PCT/768.p2 GENE.gnl/Trimastix_PCT/768~~gnl/Trimastix_PCT/768.p2  ORF type:complete len:177 (-),score=36.40 gnl/Trimastix_PCT/768:139-669(-)
MSRVLIAFFTRTGNTRKIAQYIQSKLQEQHHHVEIEEIQAEAKYSGMTGYIRAGSHAMRSKESPIAAPQHDPSGFNMIILGGPIWAWTACPPLQQYIRTMRERLGSMPAVFFACEGGSGHEKAFTAMTEALGRPPVHTMHFLDKQIKKMDGAESRAMIDGQMSQITQHIAGQQSDA